MSIIDWFKHRLQIHIQAIGNICGRIMDIPIVAAMSSGISALSSILIIGSIVAFINNFSSTGQLPIALLADLNLSGFVFFTITFFPAYLAISTAIYYGNHYKLPSINCGLGALMMFFFLQGPNFQISTTSFEISQLSSFSSGGIFLSVLCAFLAVKIIYLCDTYKLVLKLPQSVPIAVYNSFFSLVPYIFILIISFIITNVLRVNFSTVLFNALSYIITYGDNIITYTMNEFLKASFWAFGIHGDNVMAPFSESFRTYWTSLNITATSAGSSPAELPYVWAGNISRYSMWVSSALPILIMTLNSKKLKDLKPFAISCIPSTVFGIIEPLFYGLPVVLNPYFILPLIISHTATGFLTYYALAHNFVNRLSIALPWCLPAPVLAYLETSGDLRALILVLANFIIGYLIFYPFFKAFENSKH